MSDRPTDDQRKDKDKPRGPRPSSESVRIIGADEAAAAIEAGQAAGRRPDDAPRVGTRGRGGDRPHWSEPGTGEVRAILGDAEPEPAAPSDGDDVAWSTFTASPRWRDQPSDWEQPDFEAGAALSDDETRVGA